MTFNWEDNVINVRDIEEKFYEIENDLVDYYAQNYSEKYSTFDKWLETENQGNNLDVEDYINIQKLLKQIDDYGIETLYSESGIKDHILETIELPGDLPHYIRNNIDFNGIVEDLKHDYTLITHNDTDYYCI